MTWTKLDDGVFEHPKMVRAGEDAANLYVRGLVYCNRFLTDGRLDAEVLPLLTRKRNASELAAALVRAGAWEVHSDGGWMVHDFHDHNPRSEDVLAKREELSQKRAAAGKKGGLRSGQLRSNEAKAKQSRTNDEATNEASVEAPSRPVPKGQEEEEERARPRGERPLRDNPLEVLARASGGRVSPFASATDQVALAAALADCGLAGVDALEEIGRAHV